MSTKSSKRKKPKSRKGGGPKGTALSSIPKQTKAELSNPGKGSNVRNWQLLKYRYMEYEFLTYEDMSKKTGIPKNQIEKRAMVRSGQPETWKDERTRKTQELTEAGHEARKASAVELNAKLRGQIQANADLLEAVAQKSLITQGPDGAEVVPVTPREAITAMDAASRMKQGLVEEPKAKAAPAAAISTAVDQDGEGEQVGIVVLPLKQAAELWQSQNQPKK